MECEMRIRNYSERSIRSYLTAIEQISRFYNLPPGKISTDDFKKYLYHLINQEHSSISRINQNISAWKILNEDIFHRKWEGIKIKRPRREKKLPEILSREEAIRLIECTPNLKHRALMSLAYSMGLRRIEVLQMLPGDIDRERNLLRINGKGNKQREVPIPSSLMSLLEVYFKAYRPVKYLFEGYSPGQRYSESSFERVVKNAGKKAGIRRNLYPHILRHSFATHMLESGVNLKRLQILMGHSSIKTTSEYLHLANIDRSELPDLNLS